MERVQVQSATSLSSPANSHGATDMTSLDTAVVIEPLTNEDIERVMRMPNGSHLLLEFSREGRIDPEVAAKAIDRFQNTPLNVVKRFFVALVEAIAGR
jgi:hypothetical protein